MVDAEGTKMRALVRGLVLVLVNVVVFAVLLEVGSSLYVLWQHGQFYYSSGRSGLENTADVNPFMSEDYHIALHPYFGFIYKPNIDVEKKHQQYVNNHSFIFSADYVRSHPNCCDYPTTRQDPNEIVIALFGGSVAAALAYRAVQNETLSNALSTIPIFAGKKIRILPFALGGHKQPDQLLILAYYLSLGQPLDVIINIDGFNEVVYGLANARQGVDVHYPNVTQWLKMTTFLEGQADRTRNPEALVRVYHEITGQRWARRASLCPVASCFVLAKLVQYWHETNVDKSASADPAATPSSFFFQIHSPVPAHAGRDIYDVIADRWLDSSLVIQNIARSRGLPYIHVLQPNQWFRQGEPYVARRLDDYAKQLKQDIPPGYRALLDRKAKLRELGVNFLDASALLDGEPNSIYSDDCCHYQPRGYDLLMLAIIQAFVNGNVR